MPTRKTIMSDPHVPRPEFEERAKIEAALREVQSQYHQLIDELPAAYSEVDLKGNLISLNQATLDLCLRTKDELINLPYKAYLDPETVDRVFRAYNTVYKTGIPMQGFVHQLIRKDGNPITIECAISLKKENGNTIQASKEEHDNERRL